MSKTIMITGASSGIGEACAWRFASEGFRMILTGRRKNRLEKLKTALNEKYSVEVLSLSFDVSNRQQTEQAISKLPEEWRRIDVLVNNAGLALGLSGIEEGNIEDWEKMIDTNLKGLLYASRAVIPGMTERKNGHIINIGSIAGKETYPKGNVYCATKKAVDALSLGMRMDLVQYGIRVSNVSPGATETEFSEVRFHGDIQKAKKVYEGYRPLNGDDVARAVVFVATLPEHVNVNDMLIMPTAQASATVFNKCGE